MSSVHGCDAVDFSVLTEEECDSIHNALVNNMIDRTGTVRWRDAQNRLTTSIETWSDRFEFEADKRFETRHAVAEDEFYHTHPDALGDDSITW